MEDEDKGKYGEKGKAGKKQVAKAYGDYVKQFTPRPNYISNTVKAFLTGGLICMGAYYLSVAFMERGIGEKEAGTYVTILLIVIAQLLTGFGVFDKIALFAGAGVIVPITGFSNSMVAPALEFKREGLVLGVGSKMFSIAGPVLVCGITAATLAGVICRLVGILSARG